MKRSLSLLLALLLPACAGPLDADSGFGRGDRPDDDSFDDPVDAIDDEQPEDPDTDPGDDDDDEPDEPEDPATVPWDPMPQETEIGTVWVGTFTCGMLDAEAEIWMEMTPGGWEQTGRQEGHPAADVVARTDGEPYPGLAEHCFERNEPDRSVVWEDDGSFHFFNGQWDHHQRPTDLEGRWMGEVSPMFEPSDECRSALDELGLSIPVILQMTHVGTWAPQGA